MTKLIFAAVGLFFAFPAAARAQTQKTRVPVATEIKTSTKTVKTREKARFSHPDAAKRGLEPRDLVSVVEPNGHTRVVRRKKTSK